MSEIKTGGPAFPEIFTDHKWSKRHSDFMQDTYSVGGMTLRDYYIGKALQGLASRIPIDRTIDYADCADDAVLLANATIKARGESK
jgi:hypothetical protein